MLEFLALLFVLMAAGFVLLIPLLLLKVVFGAVLWLVMLPFRIVGAVLGVVGLVLGGLLKLLFGILLVVLALPLLLLAVPLLPLLLLAGLVVLVVKAFTVTACAVV